MSDPSIAATESKIARLRRENDFLRALTSNSDKACVYCGLGSEEQHRCASGFPGCARADDQQLCRCIFEGMRADEYEQRWNNTQALRSRLKELTMSNVIPVRPPTSISFECCFCHQPISNPVCGLHVELEWDQGHEQPAQQTFFCHQACFEGVTNEKIEATRPDFDDKKQSD